MRTKQQKPPGLSVVDICTAVKGVSDNQNDQGDINRRLLWICIDVFVELKWHAVTM